MLWLHELGYQFWGENSLYDLTLPEIGLLLDGKRTRGIKAQARQQFQEHDMGQKEASHFVSWAEEKGLA